MASMELIAVIFGLLSVGLLIKQNMWCWPAGLVQVSLYVVIFYDVKLYSDMGLHVAYVILQLYGWVYWKQNQEKAYDFEVTGMTKSGKSGCILFTLSVTLLWGNWMAGQTDASLPFWDAFTTVASLSAYWLMIQKKLESWVVWIIVDIVAIGVYITKGLYLTSALYVVFLIMSVIGLIAWRKTMPSFIIPPRESVPTFGNERL